MKSTIFGLALQLPIQRPQQRGLVGVVFLVIALACLVGGAIAIMSRSPQGSTQKESVRMTASTVLSYGAEMQSHYDRTASEGSSVYPFVFSYKLPVAATTFSQYANALDGMFLFATNKTFRAGTITGRDDVIIPYAGLNSQVCREINYLLHAEPVTTSPPVSSQSRSSWTNGASATIETATDVRLSRMEGCIQTAGSPIQFMYYRILKAG